MSKKLNLESLDLQSFTTTLESEQKEFKGGFQTFFCHTALCAPQDPGPDDPK